MKLILTSLAFSLIPASAFAHGDHGHSVFNNLLHVFSSPVHSWPLFVALGLAIAMLIRPAGKLLSKCLARINRIG
jgi:hypothetical protein